MGRFKNFLDAVLNRNSSVPNKYNKNFFLGLNGFTNNDDEDLVKYIESGYNINGDVFSIINQKTSKLVSIPFSIRDVKDEKANNKLNKLLSATKYNPSFTQRVKTTKLETKALSEDDFPMPFERPNPNQDWNEFFKLTATFLDLTGNFYWYKLKPEDGVNAGQPIQLYCLPSHLMKIVLKKDANLLGIEDVIDYYEMENYNYLTKFNRDEIVHVSIDNPNYGMNGEQLYGQSRLRAVWTNILASNKGSELNLELLKNAGVFGFIHGKTNSFNPEQGQGIKDRMNEARTSKQDLSNIMGSSFDMGFTRISLTPNELQYFDSLKYNQKQICNALGWSDTLLNNDDGGKHDKQELELKRVLINSIVPDAKIIERAFNENVLSEIKNYKGKALIFDYKELPEMQDDLETMSKWVINVVDNGIMNRKEARLAMRLPENKDPLLELHTVKDDVMSLEDAITPKEGLNE